MSNPQGCRNNPGNYPAGSLVLGWPSTVDFQLPANILHVNLACCIYVRMRSLRPTQDLKVWPLRVNRDVLVPTVRTYGGA